MGSDDKGLTGMTKALSTALDHSALVKQKVEECAESLTIVNAVLKEEVHVHLPQERIEDALTQSEEVQDKVTECVDDLATVNLLLEQEIADRKDLERELARSKVQEFKSRYSAFHDEVTGLPNRALLMDRLNNALAQARRHERGLALLFLDLDDLKPISGAYGHAMGDEVLRAAADRLRASVRNEDTVSRYGGEEFLCLLQEVGEESLVARIAEKIIVNLSRPFIIGGVQILIRPSIGIALYPEDGVAADALINSSDVAMCVAKRNSRAGRGGRGYGFFGSVGG